MPSESRDRIKNTLIANYRDLLARLTRQFGSREVAEDALQDTWLQLERAGQLGTVRNERAFIMQIAFNRVRDRLKYERRNVSSDEIPETADNHPDPERSLEARSELLRLAEVIRQMPPRRRAILLMACDGETSTVEIAKRFGITPRWVNKELAKAREACALNINAANKSGKTVLEITDATVLAMKSLRKPKDEK